MGLHLFNRLKGIAFICLFITLAGFGMRTLLPLPLLQFLAFSCTTSNSIGGLLIMTCRHLSRATRCCDNANESRRAEYAGEM